LKAFLSNQPATPFGGLVPILKKMKEHGIPQIIRSSFKNRKKQSIYGYDDIIIGWIATAYAGGNRLKHITKLKDKFTVMPKLKIPSHDCLGRGLKQLATETMIFENITKDGVAKVVTTEYNDNIEMNRMLVRATKRMGALEEGRKYTLDIDQTFLRTERRGAKRNVNAKGTIDYTKIGFSPMVSLIGHLPVYISLRNGNAAPGFQFYETVVNTLSLLEEQKIRIGRVVSDSAGYNKNAMELLDKKGIKFNIRFHYNKKMARFNQVLLSDKIWRETEIETANHIWKCGIADIPYTMSKKRKTDPDTKYRIVAVRIPTETTRAEMESLEEQERREYIKEKLKKLSRKKVLKELQRPYEDLNWKEIGKYSYKFYITNDYERTAESIVKEYNMRGKAERNFTFMKNDFGWNLPPFMNLNENNVFLIVSALANNIFRACLKLFKKAMPWLRLNMRLPEFRFEFVSVVCEYTDTGYYKFNSSEVGYLILMV
jgi:hypothetical protein